MERFARRSQHYRRYQITPMEIEVVNAIALAERAVALLGVETALLARLYFGKSF